MKKTKNQKKSKSSKENHITKKTILILIVVLIIIAIIGILYFKVFKKDTPVEEATNETTSEEVDDDDLYAFISVGSHITTYNTYNMKIDTTQYSNKEIAEKIIDSIESIVHYEIITNSITPDETSITIDFSSESAPFNLKDTFLKNDSSYSVNSLTDSEITYIIFDSISKNFKKYFGSDLTIYFSVDGEDISLTDIDPQLTLTTTTPYTLESQSTESN